MEKEMDEWEELITEEETGAWILGWGHDEELHHDEVVECC